MARTKRQKPADIPTGLTYLAVPGRRFRGAPARDLDQADLDRLAYRREMSRIGADGHRPSRTADPAIVAEIKAELVNSGLYTPKTKEGSR